MSALWISHTGLGWTLTSFILVGAFISGFLVPIYLKTNTALVHFRSNINSNLKVKPGIRKIIDAGFVNIDANTKFDRRITGSSEIDERLHEIIELVIRDSISQWYGRISADANFAGAIRSELQDVAIDLCARIKKVPWVGYMTKRMIDDVVPHLRLYRLAFFDLKATAGKKQAPQTLASFKNATETAPGGHSRNNSESFKCHSRNNSMSDSPIDLENAFFRLEADENLSRFRHHQLCTNREAEKRYLEDILDIVLYIILPSEDFKCLPARVLVRELLIGGVLLPIIDLITDPHTINMCFIRLCGQINLSSDAFLATIRATVDKQELLVLAEFVSREISLLRSKDSGSDTDVVVRQQLNSLLYVRKCVELRLQGGAPAERSANDKSINLPLPVILKNSLALSYIIDYLSVIDMERLIFLHLSIDSWRCSARAELEKCEKLGKSGGEGSEMLKEAAKKIWEQYFKSDSPCRVALDPIAELSLAETMASERVSYKWFDELLRILHEKISSEHLGSFYKSPTYLKLLGELDLLKEGDQDDESASPDSVSLADCSELEDFERQEPISGCGRFHMKVEIIDSGVVQDRGRTYGVYALSVSRMYENGFAEKWHVYRRYSDFYDLQQKIKDAYADLGKLPFPGKKTFNNMGAITLSKRVKMLNDYLQILLGSGVAETHPRLIGFLWAFLKPAEYDKAGTIGSALESVVSPIKSSMRSMTAAVRVMPENLLTTVDGLSRSLQARREKEGIDDPDAPLRIMLMLMDEIFDLQSRNQWLQRRIVTLLRQMFGDIMNKKIIDFLEDLLSCSRIAGFLTLIKDIAWPGGIRATTPKLDDALRHRIKIVAKTALLSALSEDLKHLLGSDTSRKGILRAYNTFQHPVINRRLFYVLFEGILEQIFPPITDVLGKMSQVYQPPAK